MNKKVLLVLTALAVCFCFILSACTPIGNNNNNPNNPNNNDSDDDNTYYTVTFDSQGGSPVESRRVLAGNPVAAPASPKRENFDFDGWYKSADENAAKWNFSTDRVNANLTLYARWTAKQEEETPSETLTFEQSADGYIVTGDSGQAANIVIPAEHGGAPVVGIADSAFAYSKHTSDILSVTIPDSVTEIGRNAFQNQNALETVKIGEGSGLESIGSNAFSGCSALTSFYLPAECVALGYDATPASFADEDSDYIDSFGEVFNNCGALRSFTVAAGNPVFASRGGHLVCIGGKHNSMGEVILIRGVNAAEIPSGVTKIGKAAFRRATIASIAIPASVKSIGNYAFSDSAVVTVTYGGTTDEWNEAVKGENGKEVSWKSSNQNITVRCSDTQGDDTETDANILIAYFSATNNTEGVARIIADITGGQLYEITPAVPYTAADLNYGSSSSRTSNENSDPSARPDIRGSVENMESYDVVFLGYPIWYGKAPKIIYTFLESYSFSGKTIIPFCTSASSGMGSSADNLHSLVDGATWQSGMRFPSSASQSAVRSWLDGLKY